MQSLALAAALVLVLAPSRSGRAGRPRPDASAATGASPLPAAGAFVPRAVAIDAAGPHRRRRLPLRARARHGDGTCLADGDTSFRLARLTPDGGLDPEFGDNGFVTTPIGDGRSQALDVARAGRRRHRRGRRRAASAGRDVFALARYTADGALDPSFGDGGVGAAAGRRRATPRSATSRSGPAARCSPPARPSTRRARRAWPSRASPPPARSTRASAPAASRSAARARYGYGLGARRRPRRRADRRPASPATPRTGRRFRFGELRSTAAAARRGFDRTARRAAGRHRVVLRQRARGAAPAAAALAAGAATVADGRQAMAVAAGDDSGALDRASARAAPARRSATARSPTTCVADAAGGAWLVGQVGARRWLRVRDRAARRRRRARQRLRRRSAWLADYPIARATAGALQRSGRLVTVGIGCAGGVGRRRCDGGTPVLLVARQLRRRPRRARAIRVAARVTRARAAPRPRVRVRLGRARELDASSWPARQRPRVRLLAPRSRRARRRGVVRLRRREPRACCAATRAGRCGCIRARRATRPSRARSHAARPIASSGACRAGPRSSPPSAPPRATPRCSCGWSRRAWTSRG